MGNKVYQVEEENLTLNVNFYNLPAGYMPTEVKNEVERVTNSALVSGKTMETLKPVVKVWKGTCQIYQGIVALDRTVALLHSLMSWTQYSPVAWIEVALRGISFVTGGIVKITGKIFEYGCAAASCELVQKIIGDLTNNDDTVSKALSVLIKNPERSIYSSMYTLCVPGVYYNLEKARQVECKYIKCLRDEVPAGLPVSICTNMRGYDWCKYVYTQNWGWIPGVSYYNALLEALSSAIKNPFAVAGAILGLGCLLIPEASTSSTCKWMKVISGVGQVADYISGLGTTFSTEGDLCAEVLNATTE
jgi:hypothetical protein